MPVEIEPKELGFRRPFTHEVTETLKIKNPSSIPVAFKVKTTAPKQYCVRPNSGRIEPGHEVDVSVLLQAMKQDPPADFKCRDKFLVQSVPINGEKVVSSVNEIWDKAQKSDIQENKIRVVFLASEDPDALSPAVTPARPISSNGVDATPDVPAPSFTSPRENMRSVSNISGPLGSSPEGASERMPSPSVSASRDAPAYPVLSNDDDKDAVIASLKKELAEKEALVSSLSTDSGLRQRKGAAIADSEKSGSAPSAQTAQVVRGTEGISVPVTASLCVFCFLLAYFFF